MNDRDCENCIHHTKKGCSSWDCKFEQITKREKAIKKLKDILEEATETDNSVCYVTSDDADDLKVAINSLEIDERYELEYEQIESCEDAISREYLVEHIKACWTNGRPMYSPDLSELLSWIDDVQLVQPKPIECEDAISRQAALECLTATGLKKFDFILDARDKIKNLPPVTPQPKTGRWLERNTYPQECRCWDCSQCQETVFERTNYCPNCGAKMQEVEENG